MESWKGQVLTLGETVFGPGGKDSGPSFESMTRPTKWARGLSWRAFSTAGGETCARSLATAMGSAPICLGTDGSTVHCLYKPAQRYARSEGRFGLDAEARIEQ